MAAEIEFSQNDEDMVSINDALMYDLLIGGMLKDNPDIRKKLDKYPIKILSSKILVHHELLPSILSFAKKIKQLKSENNGAQSSTQSSTHPSTHPLSLPLILTYHSNIEFENDKPRLDIFETGMCFDRPGNVNVDLKVLPLFDYTLNHKCLLLSPSTKKTNTLNVKIISLDIREKLKRGQILKFSGDDCDSVEYFKVEYQKIVERPRCDFLKNDDDKLKMHIITQKETHAERSSNVGINYIPFQIGHLTLHAQFILIIMGIVYKDDKASCTQICRLTHLT